MHTPHLWPASDRNEWCPVGPGARRGLNRLHGRPTSMAVSVRDAPSERRFLEEMVALHEALWRAEEEWCRELDIELHDVQFQLCEFDKYERIRRGEGGRKTKYVPLHEQAAVGAPSARPSADAAMKSIP